MLYIGTHELTVDPKNRLSIPAGVKREMDPEEDGESFVLVPGDWPGSLSLYGDRYFRRMAERRHASLDPGEEADMFETVFYSRATNLDIDKQRRVVLPQWMLDLARIGKHVTLSGARDHLILWDREAHARFMDENGARCRDLLRQAQLKTQQARSNGSQG